MPFTFTLTAQWNEARTGLLKTPHGRVETPCFMPVGTHAAVKGVGPETLRQCGADLVLANAYHLAVRPGEERVRAFGGLAAFMGWHGPTLTDSGGYQVFSLAANRTVTDEGVFFQNHVDGAPFALTPERAVEIQQALGPDVFMALDECPPADATRDEVARATARTHAWAARCRDAWTARDTQALFGIVQGGLFADLRTESVEAIGELDLPGHAIGGVSVGEDPVEIDRIVASTAPQLDASKPRYLMGVGRPQDILRAVGHGVDLFDCVMPTRHARHAQAFTASGMLNLRNQIHAESREPVDPGCDCPVCQIHTRGYLRHLFQSQEMLGPVCLTVHNLRFYLRMMEDAREAIEQGRFGAFAMSRIAELEAGEGGRDP